MDSLKSLFETNTTSDYVVWTPSIKTVNPDVYDKWGKLYETKPLLVLNAAPQDPRLSNQVLWHHLYFQCADKENPNTEKYFHLPIRGKFVGPYLMWYRDADDTPPERIDVLRTRADVLSDIVAESYPPSAFKFKTPIKVLGCRCPTLNADAMKFEGTYFVQSTYYLPNFLNVAKSTTYDNKRTLDLVQSITSLYHIPEIAFEGCSFVAVTERFRTLINDGDRLGVFRKRLHKERPIQLKSIDDDLVWLRSKAYKYRPTEEEFGDLWQKNLGKSQLYASLARNGILEVSHQSPFRGSLREVMTTMLRYTTPDPDSSETRYSRMVAVKFVETLLKHLCRVKAKEIAREIKAHGKHRTQIAWFRSVYRHLLKARQLTAVSVGSHEVQRHRERQRYIVTKLDRVSCTKCERVIPPFRLAEIPGVAAAFLEGHLVYPHGDGRVSIEPSVKAVGPKTRNHATLDEELFMLGFQRCLIYASPKTVLHAGNIADNDDTYWRCLIRAFQHFLAVKTAVHLLEDWTIKATKHIPELMTQFENFERCLKTTEKSCSVNIEDPAESFVKDMEAFAKYVPVVREVSVASSAFRAAFVVEKFHYLGTHIFHLPEIFRNIQHNIDELASFLQYFKQRRLVFEQARRADEERDRDNRLGRYIAILGLLLAVVGLFLTAVPFADTLALKCPEEFAWWVCRGGGPDFHEKPNKDYAGAFVVYITLFMIIHGIALLAYERFVKDELTYFERFLVTSPFLLGLLLSFYRLNFGYHLVILICLVAANLVLSLSICVYFEPWLWLKNIARKLFSSSVP